MRMILDHECEEALPYFAMLATPPKNKDSEFQHIVHMNAVSHAFVINICALKYSVYD